MKLIYYCYKITRYILLVKFIFQSIFVLGQIKTWNYIKLYRHCSFHNLKITFTFSLLEPKWMESILTCIIEFAISKYNGIFLIKFIIIWLYSWNFTFINILGLLQPWIWNLGYYFTNLIHNCYKTRDIFFLSSSYFEVFPS
jgi:hypothetical protein